MKYWGRSRGIQRKLQVVSVYQDWFGPGQCWHSPLKTDLPRIQTALSHQEMRASEGSILDLNETWAVWCKPFFQVFLGGTKWHRRLQKTLLLWRVSVLWAFGITILKVDWFYSLFNCDPLKSLFSFLVFLFSFSFCESVQVLLKSVIVLILPAIIVLILPAVTWFPSLGQMWDLGAGNIAVIGRGVGPALAVLFHVSSVVLDHSVA